MNCAILDNDRIYKGILCRSMDCIPCNSYRSILQANEISKQEKGVKMENKLEISNKVIMSVRFWNSFNRLLTVKELDVVSKLGLIKLRKELCTAVEDIKSASKDEDDANALLKHTTPVTIPTLKVKDVINYLSAEDIILLEPILLQ